jgi:hypothetical protein
MNAVVQHEAPASEATALIQVIERAANNPAVDIDKMERLLQMQERIMDRNAKAAYTAALAEMQPKLPIITERGEIKNNAGKVQSTYAKWEDINEAVKPVLAEHGFALTFRTGSEAGQIKVTGVLSHRDGHSEETTLCLPADTSGSKNAVQALASSVSYGKRYTSGALLNITSRGEDDDGQKAGAGKTLSEDQAKKVREKLKSTSANEVAFLKWAKCDRIEDILAVNFDAVIETIEAKAKQRK